jgi:hypothetical protein
MNKFSRTVLFDEPGSENTESVLEAVSEKIDETGIKTIVIASTSGKTAIKFAKALKEKAEVVAVSWKIIPSESIKELENLGVKICDFENYLPLHEIGRDLVRNTLYALGQGIKVCVEVVLIAVDKGIVSLGQDVIAVGGTGSGSDSAMVVRATSTADMFGSDIQKRLEIREIFALPKKKKWWK